MKKYSVFEWKISNLSISPKLFYFKTTKQIIVLFRSISKVSVPFPIKNRFPPCRQSESVIFAGIAVSSFRAVDKEPSGCNVWEDVTVWADKWRPTPSMNDWGPLITACTMASNTVGHLTYGWYITSAFPFSFPLSIKYWSSIFYYYWIVNCSVPVVLNTNLCVRWLFHSADPATFTHKAIFSCLTVQTGYARLVFYWL